MTVEEKLAHFLEASVQENTSATEAMLQSYQASLDEQFASHKNQIDRQASAELSAETEALRREGNKQLAHEHLVIKHALSQKHQELTDKVFEELSELLASYKKTEDYTQLLIRQIKNARAFSRNDGITIYIDPDDTSKKEFLEQETGCQLVVSQYSFGGGIRAVIPGRHILIDNSFDSRIAEQKANFHFNGGNVNG